jgi:hypothetical protein
MIDIPGRPMLLTAWAVLIAGLLGAVATVRALGPGDARDPNTLAMFIVFVPYIAAAMLLHITRKARLVIIAMLVPALADIAFGFAFTLGATPGWDAQISWRLLRCLACSILLAVALGVGLWFERIDSGAPDSDTSIR